MGKIHAFLTVLRVENNFGSPLPNLNIISERTPLNIYYSSLSIKFTRLWSCVRTENKGDGYNPVCLNLKWRLQAFHRYFVASYMHFMRYLLETWRCFCTQLPSRLFLPKWYMQKTVHFLLHLPIGMGSYDKDFIRSTEFDENLSQWH